MVPWETFLEFVLLQVREQCTNLVSGKKWCPQYIFASYNEATALKNWKAFKSLVKKYLDALNGVPTNTAKENTETNLAKISAGDLVKVSKGAVWTTGKPVPEFVINDKWFVKSVNGSRVVIDKDENGSNSIMSPIDAKYLTVVKTVAETKKTITEIAKEVIAGKWYTGSARKNALTNAGYDYNEVQAEVNRLLK